MEKTDVPLVEELLLIMGFEASNPLEEKIVLIMLSNIFQIRKAIG
jgi:hypothetical protein